MTENFIDKRAREKVGAENMALSSFFYFPLYEDKAVPQSRPGQDLIQCRGPCQGALYKLIVV